MVPQTSFAADGRLSEFDDGHLLRLVHDAIIRTDRDGVVLVWNPGAERVYGYSEPEMLGRHISEVYFPEDLAQFPSSEANPVEAAAGGRNLTEINLRRRHKDGRPLTISLRISAIRDAAGELTGFVTCSNDITRRKAAEEALTRAYAELEERVEERTRELSVTNLRLHQQIGERQRAEAALRASRERLAHLLQSSPGVLYSCGVSGAFGRTFVSPNAVQVLGYEAEGFLSEPDFWLERVHRDDRASARALRECVIRDGRHCAEYRFLHADGTWRVIRDSAVAASGGAGRPSEIVGYWLDVTEEKQAEETRREQERLRFFAETLLSAEEAERKRISRELHDDLNQRLAALILDMGLLEKGLPDSPRQIRRRLSLLRKNAAKISDAVQVVALRLHSARLEQFGLPVALERECAELQRLTRIRVAFQCTLSKTLPYNVSLSLYRIAQECLRNTARHSGARRASVTLEESESAVKLRIRDDGVGFSPEARPSPKSLGLTSINDRARLLKGTVTVDSQIGHGACVEVILPSGSDQ